MSNRLEKDYDIKQEYNHQDDVISFADILLVVARQIKIIIITPTIVCLIALINALFFSMPVYKSTAKIISSTGRGEISQAAGIAAQFGISLPSAGSKQVWVYPEIVKSRTLARSMLKRKFDTVEFGPQKTLFQILSQVSDDSGAGYANRESKAVDNFLKMISIEEDAQTGIFTLIVMASEPKFAAEVNRVLIEELDSHQRKYNQSKNNETKQFILERITDTEKELMVAEENLKVFKDRNRRIENSPALQLEQQRISREVAVLTGVFTTLKQQLETIKIEGVNESSYVIILDAPEVPIYRSDKGKKQKLILAGVFGLFLGLVFAFAFDYLKKIYKEDEEKMSLILPMIVKNINEIVPRKSNK